MNFSPTFKGVSQWQSPSELVSGVNTTFFIKFYIQQPLGKNVMNISLIKRDTNASKMVIHQWRADNVSVNLQQAGKILRGAKFGHADLLW